MKVAIYTHRTDISLTILACKTKKLVEKLFFFQISPYKDWTMDKTYTIRSIFTILCFIWCYI